MSKLSDRERAIRQRLKDDFPHYAEKCLKIREKSGKVAAFELNRAQRYIHERLEQQRTTLGRVRALILKGRQQGVSTYVSGRFYHKATHARGCRVFILTHEDPATQNLFEMVERYHDNVPEIVRPVTGAANAKELFFSALDSGYKVGTAGSKGVGRSSTIQLFHGSEVAFWPNADDHAAGILQAVPEEPGTEIVLESTAKGLGNYFHTKWKDAQAGRGDFIAIFVPWYWQDEYRRAVPQDFQLGDEERAYAALYGLDLEQMAWRRNKIAELKDPLLFKQEYPATADEAFQTTGHDSFIPPELVLKARKSKCEAIGPLVLGVDPSRFGDDRFSIAWRQGRKLWGIENKTKLDAVAGANWVKSVIDEDKPDRVFIDVGGPGSGVIDILMSYGKPYSDVIRAIDFGGAPQTPVIFMDDGSKRPGPRNRRAEMWMRSKDWLKEAGGVQIPDDDSIQADACAPGYSYDMNQRLQIEKKEHMRARNVPSPDQWDAVVLTFAEPVAHRPDLYFENNSADWDFASETRSSVTGY